MEATLEELLEEGIDTEHIEAAKIDKPEKPDFPFIIFALALAKDIGDWLSLGVGGTILNIIVVPIMFIYLRGKMGYVKKWVYRRYIFTMIIEFIPFINWIPQNAIFVVRAHLKEHEQIDKLLSFVESFLEGKVKS